MKAIVAIALVAASVLATSANANVLKAIWDANQLTSWVGKDITVATAESKIGATEAYNTAYESAIDRGLSESAAEAAGEAAASRSAADR